MRRIRAVPKEGRIVERIANVGHCRSFHGAQRRRVFAAPGAIIIPIEIAIAWQRNSVAKERIRKVTETGDVETDRPAINGDIRIAQRLES